MTNLDIGLIGYGEVGKIFGNELRAKGVSWIGAWDVKFADAAAGSAERRHAQAHGVVACESARELCSKAQLIISAVTASNTLEVAKEAARWIGRGATFLDFNSASPGTKRQAATLIEDAGAHYVEAGVMTSVPPYGIAVPMLLGGKQAPRLADRLRPLGFNVTPLSPKIGVAAATKMSRSIMIKGLEALVIESFTTARRHRLAQAGRVFLQSRCTARQAAGGGDARGRQHGARGGLHANVDRISCRQARLDREACPRWRI